MSQQQAKAAPVSLEELLTHAAWARRLARGLMSSDSAAAEDTVQDAFLAAVQAPPASGGALRGWLRKVLTHERASRLLSDRRREARELAAPPLAVAESPPSPEELAATVEVQRLLAGFVLALPEPFRQTLVLRYYEDRSSAEIARLLSVPAGTVRWRLKKGLSRLRARLDHERGGGEAWRAVLSPIATASKSEPAGRVGSAARLPARTGLLAGAGALAVAGAAVGLWTLGPGAPLHPGGAPAATSGPGAAGSRLASAWAPDVSRSIPAQGQIDQEVDSMKTVQLKRVAAFVGVGLPAMVASARQGAVPPPQEVIGLCMTAQEKSFECKDEVVAAWLVLRNPPEKYREAMRRKMLEEITTWGSGPLAPRREKCEQLAGSAGVPSPAALDQDKEVMATMRACFARPDCPTRAACIGQLMTTGALPEVGLSSKDKEKP